MKRNLSLTILPVLVLTCSLISSCKKDFLDAKPSTDIIVPRTLSDFENLLNNNQLNLTAALGNLSSDDYEFNNFASWQAASATERNAYIWAKDIFEGEIDRMDWNKPYSSIFYANNILQGLDELNDKNSPTFKQIKGWALFVRAYSLYDLLQHFSEPYDQSNSNKALGVPIRLKPGIDELSQRSTAAECYQQIFQDLNSALNLLSSEFQISNRFKPSKVTVYAFLSRIYLNMNNYTEAERFAELTLSIYDKLIDYNSISQTSTTPFSRLNEEAIFTSSQVLTYSSTNTISSNTSIRVNPEILSSYAKDDLRLPILFGQNTTGSYFKRGYFGGGSYPFSGLATDEIYLIKAECLARRNQTILAMEWLNKLLVMRFKTGSFQPISAESPEEALSIILLERRKELIWRGIRWQDIKRLNKTGAEITLKRTLNGQQYLLPPNDLRYTFPIPEDEISRSKIQQNIR
ncbi:RagB/SusD family nutrient uptake outer membrane protein [Pedobacter sp. ASV1-7]|uniref:RagB/SusD family nutrient uptake outer membrane protein n=1 Tax=Pedobacter sp. ASV1-7 TaxID=3145237 RepID=UPI0032E8F493